MCLHVDPGVKCENLTLIGHHAPCSDRDYVTVDNLMMGPPFSTSVGSLKICKMSVKSEREIVQRFFREPTLSVLDVL